MTNNGLLYFLAAINALFFALNIFMGNYALAGLNLACGMFAFGTPRYTKRILGATPKPKELAVDEHGFRKDYDPHYTRALELEQGVPEGLLTTCADKNCFDCQPGRPHELNAAPEIKVKTGADETFRLNADKVYQASKRESEAIAAEIARRTKALELGEKYGRTYSPTEFIPAAVPRSATPTMTNLPAGGVEIRWTWRGGAYRQVLKDYELHHIPVAQVHSDQSVEPIQEISEPVLKLKRPTYGNSEFWHEKYGAEKWSNSPPFYPLRTDHMGFPY